jgi:glycosyltransferase involved in cell wall biosynthesis
MTVVLVSNGPSTIAERDPLARRQVPLLTRLAARGVKTTIVLLGDRGGLASPLERAGIGVHVIATPLAPRAASLARLPLAVIRLRALLHRLTPDILEGQEPLPAIAAGLAASGRRRPMVVYRRHHQTGRRRLIAASRAAARLAHYTIVSCEAMREQAARQDRVSADRIGVAVSGVADAPQPPPAVVSAIRRRLGISDEARVIGVVSRLRWEKGLDVLMACLDRIDDIGDLHVVVVGDGPEEPALRRLAAGHRVTVHFQGHQDDVTPWLAVADVVAMPSRREAFGRVTLEAMAASRPVVASNVGGLAEAVIDGTTGLLVPPEDPAALAAALRTLLDSPAAAQRMGEAGRRRYEASYTIDHMAAAWHDTWQRVIDARGLS